MNEGTTPVHTDPDFLDFLARLDWERTENSRVEEKLRSDLTEAMTVALRDQPMTPADLITRAAAECCTDNSFAASVLQDLVFGGVFELASDRTVHLPPAGSAP